MSMDEKIVTLDEMCRLSNEYQRMGKTVVFTNGCFDILHAGHVSYLARAKACGDILVLGLNSDASIKGIKGENRPVVPEDQRATVMAALAVVDHVILFDAPDPGDIIRIIVPQVLVKGEDWPEDKIIGADFVKSAGGRVERIAFDQDVSTTRIIKRIGKRFYGAC